MKTIFIILLTVLSLPQMNRQETLKFCLEKLSKTQLPYVRPRDYFVRVAYGISKKMETQLPVFAYKDVGGAIPTNYKSDEMRIFQRFQIKSDKYELVAWQVGISTSQKILLTTMDKNTYDFIDWIEVEISCVEYGNTFGKEWTIDENEQVGVYQVKPLSPEPVLFYPDFKEFKGQRVDTYYKIDDNAKFIQTRQIKYEPRIYTNVELRNVNKAIRLGNETVVRE